MTSDNTDRLKLTDEEWRQRLHRQRYAVLRQGATEPAFAGAYVDTEHPGVYRCGGCGTELFRSETKYHSGSGWPSFTEPISDDVVQLKEDRSHGMVRTEVTCRRCGGHLGHVFDDGPGPNGLRYCMNSIALDFEHRG